MDILSTLFKLSKRQIGAKDAPEYPGANTLGSQHRLTFIQE